MEFLLLILGAILSILGGFIHRWYENHQDKKQNDKFTLIQMMDVIMAIDRLYVIPSVRGTDIHSLIRAHSEGRRDFVGYMDVLYRLSFEIQREKNQDISLEVREFVNENRLKVGKARIEKTIKSLKTKIEERIGDK